MKTPSETSPPASDVAALVEEAVHSLSDGFAIFDSEDRLLFGNATSRKSFATTYSGMESGLTYAEAHFIAVKKALPHLSDEEVHKVADKLVDRMRVFAHLETTRDHYPSLRKE